MTVSYNQCDNSIIFKFLFYDISRYMVNEISCLTDFRLSYSEDGEIYTELIRSIGRLQPRDFEEVAWMRLSTKRGEKIVFPDRCQLEKEVLFPNNDKMVGMRVTDERYKVDDILVRSKSSYMNIKWRVPQSCKRITSVKLVGGWTIFVRPTETYRFEHVYVPDNVKSNLNSLKNAPSEMMSVINNNVKVIGETDAIIVTGAKPGDNIKVYTVSGVEVKSVVANDDVENIKLPKNQLYIVKAGQARCKVAL